MNKREGRRRSTLAILAAFAVLVWLAAPFVGIKGLDPRLIWQPISSSMDAEIFWRLRVPRTSLAFMAGAALSLCGMVFQALFRNPLATPYTLGVSSGASLGAVLYLYTGITFTVLGVSGVTLAAFAGAMLSIAVVLGLAGHQGYGEANTTLLAGVAVSLFFSSLILFFQYLSDFTNSIRIMRWLMGGLETVGMQPIWQLMPVFLLGLAVVFYFRRELNLLMVGEEFAASRGTQLKLVKYALFLATSLTVAGVVSLCGPIGFVGMIAPHICRLLIGPDHRYLAPATVCFGGAFLTLCDIISRMLIPPAEIPVGVITAIMGGPFFLWLLTQRRKTVFGGAS